MAIALLAASTLAHADGKLDPGIKAFNAGKNDAAIKAFSGLLGSGGVSGADLARTYYFRGLSYAKTKKHAQAISDLTQALWLKGLSAEESNAALEARAGAYQAAGLGERARADLVRVGKAVLASATTAASSSAPSATASTTMSAETGTAASSWTSSTSPETVEAPALAVAPAPSAPAETGSTSIFGSGSMFGSLFSGGSSDGGSGSRPAGSVRDASGSEAGPVPIRPTKTATAPAAAAIPVAPAPEVSTTPSVATGSWEVASTEPIAPASAESGGWEVSPADTAAAPAPAPAAKAPKSSAGVGSLFEGLFSGFGSSSGSSESAPAPAATASVTPAAPSGTAKTVEPLPWQSEATGGSPAAAPTSRFRLQVGSLRDEAEASALASRIAAEQAGVLAGARTFVEPTVLGNMGTFYLVQVGPLPDERSSLKLCTQLKRNGVDCFLVEK